MAVRLVLASVKLAFTWNEELEQGRPAQLHRVVSTFINMFLLVSAFLPCLPAVVAL